MILIRIWDELKPLLTTNAWVFAAPDDAPDGIGSALAEVRDLPRPEEMQPLKLKVKRLSAIKDAPSWCDLWFMANDSDIYPLRYIRFGILGAEWGVVHGGKPEDQEIIGTYSMGNRGVSTYYLSADKAGLNILPVGPDWGGRTWSLRGKRHFLYVEGASLELEVEGDAR